MSLVKSALRLGQTEFRLPSPYQAVFLKPPHYRSYITADLEKKRIIEYDLRTGQAIGVFGSETVYQLYFPAPAKNVPRMVRVPTARSGGLQIWDVSADRLLFDMPTPTMDDDFLGSLSDDGRLLAFPSRNMAMEQREADADMEGHFYTGVQVFDVDSQKLIREIATLHNYGLNPKFSPNGRWLAIRGELHAVKNEESDEEKYDWYRQIERTIQIWDIDQNVEASRIVIPPEHLVGAWTFASDLPELAVWYYHGPAPICFFDLRTGRETRRLVLPEERAITSFVTSPSAEYAAAIDVYSGAVLRWDLAVGTILDITPCPFLIPSSINDRDSSDMVISNEGQVTVLQRIGLAICAWSAPDGIKISAVSGHFGAVRGIAFSSDGSEVWSVSQGADVCRWGRDGLRIGDFAVPQDLGQYLLGHQDISSIGWIVCRSSEGQLTYELATGRHRSTMHAPGEGEYVDPSITPDGRFYFTVVGDGMGETLPTAYLENIATGEKRNLGIMPPDFAWARICGSHLVVVAESDENDTRTISARSLATVPPKQVWAVTTPRGKNLDVYSREYQATLRPLRPGEPTGHRSFPYQTTLIPALDGKSVLVLPTDEGCRPFVLDMKDGRRLSQWPMPAMPPFAVCPGGSAIAITTGRGYEVSLIDWHSGRCLEVLLERAFPESLAWSADGRCLAVGLGDTTVMMLELTA